MRKSVEIGPYDVVPFRPERNATIDTLRWARKRHGVVTLLEVDVTAAREAIRDHRTPDGGRLSFTAWVVGCVAKAASEHPRVHAVRRGNRKLILFHEVDVAVVIERAIEADGETLPMPYVIRRANGKSALQIHDEIRQAQTSNTRMGSATIEAGPGARMQHLFFRLPAWCRDVLFWRWLLRNPAQLKKRMGTIAVSATGMAAPGVLAWGIPLSIHPLAIGIGGIAQRSTATGAIDILALTLTFDHAVTDGAPVGRFIRRLHELMTQADGLNAEDSLNDNDARIENSSRER